MNDLSDAQSLAGRMLQGVKDLRGMTDARQVSRYIVALTREIVPAADLIAFHVLNAGQREFYCLGVFGAPHYGDTLHTPLESSFGELLSNRMPLWLRNAAEINKALSLPDDGSESFTRHHMIHRSVAAQPHRNLVIQPCIFDGALRGSLWVESWGAQRFSRRDIERCELIAQLSSLALSECVEATVHDSNGLSRQISLPHSPHAGQETTPLTRDENPAIRPDPPAPSLKVNLTDREQMVLRNLAKGMSNAEVAEEMFVSINTVRSHRRSVMSKLDAHNSTELLLQARKAGLVD